MACAQGLKEVHYVQTLSPKEFTYEANEGGWILPSDCHPTAKLPKALRFWITGKVDYQLKKLKSVVVEFDISIADGTPTMKDSNPSIGFRLGYDHDFTYFNVKDQILKMKTDTKTTIKATFPVAETADHGKTLNILFLQTIPPKPIGGLTFYGAKVEQIGEE